MCGAALVWVVMHLRRNAYFRKHVGNNRKLNRKLKNILQHSREVIYSVDAEAGQFEYLSPSVFSLTGYSQEEAESMTLNDWIQQIHPEDQERIFRLSRELLYQPEEREWQGVVEYRFRHRDGQYRSLSDHLYIRYSSSGDIVMASGSVRDVTQIVRLEESLHVLERKFQESQKMAGLGLLSSGIAHDFNNLMTVILGNTELALLENEGPDHGVLDEIKKTTLRAAELANQMLVYTGKTALVINSINLCSVVKEMAALLDVAISKKVRLEYSLADGVPMIRGDVSQIRQVAMNLITNASEAIGDNEGVIAISIRSVFMKPADRDCLFPPGSQLEGDYVRLEVSDTGVGMDESTRQKIFDPLFTTKVTGRGLGLASLLNAVQRHNGVVEVESQLGHGTVFRIYFPIEKQEQESEKNHDAVTDETWRGCGTALIADDEPAILGITSALLERLGFRILTASNGLETVDLYTQNAEDITLLLMDINMPKLNGLEATSRIRHINPQVPVLFMSGYPRSQIMERFGRQPHTEFIKKPFEGGELTAAIQKVMAPLRGD